MKSARLALVSAVLLAAGSLEARVVSYAPVTARPAVPATQKRANTRAVLVERVSVPPPGGAPICIDCFNTLGRLVVHDARGAADPVDVTPGGAPASILAAAAFEAPDGALSILVYTSASLAPGEHPSGSMRLLFSRDAGATWSALSLPQGFWPTTNWLPDVGGPVVHAGTGIVLGSADAPFALTISNETGARTLWSVLADGTVRPLAVFSGDVKLLGSDREGRRFLVLGTFAAGGTSPGSTGLWSAAADASPVFLAPFPFPSYVAADGWITPSGAAYVTLGEPWLGAAPPSSNWTRSVALAAGGTLTTVATTMGTNPTDLFAVPSGDFSGAWVLQRGDGPTVLSAHTAASGLVETWRDVSRPEVEALHAGASGRRLLVQVHRPRPQVDQRIFRDPALAVWEVGSPAPASYDELFLNEQSTKGFVHLDVDAVGTGEPFLFDSGVAQFGGLVPGPAGPSGSGGGADVVQEWGVVRGSLRQRLVIPASARSGGLYGAAWRTDVVLRNPDADPVAVTATLLPNPDTGIASSTRTLALPASSVVTETDVLSTLFGLDAGAGAILLAPEGNRSIEATSRTYTAGAAGSYGMSVGAVDVFAAVGPSFPVTFSAGLQGAGFRTNLVATDVSGRGSAAALRLMGDSASPDPLDGAILAPASGQRQLTNLAASLGALPWRTGALLYAPTAGASVAGLIAIDNTTNDPTWFPPDVPTTVPRTIPAIVHADGAHGAKFRTDLFLFNPSARTQSITLAVKDWSANTGEQLLTLPLLANESKTIRDVLFSAFGRSGVARLRFQTAGTLDDTGGVRVTSRTYTLGPDGGTYGLLLPALNAFQSAGGGESLEILLPAGGAGFRTNLALVDLSAAPGNGTTSVRVEIFDEAGVRRDVFETPVPLAGGVQLDDLFHGRGLGDGPRAGWIRVSPAGGLVAAYASVIDQGTNDPLYAPAGLAAKP